MSSGGRSGGFNVAGSHVDLATFGAIHFAALIGGPGARVVFIKRTVKSNAYSLFPARHQVTSGSGSNVFGAQKISWKLSRIGDYITSTWIRFDLSSVTRSASESVSGSTEFLRWTHNLAHNLIDNIDLNFTQVTGASLDSFFFDFFSAFSVPGGKRNAYDNMIGNIPDLVNPAVTVPPAVAGNQQVLPGAILNLPLPLPYTRDVGVSLPSGALIYNEVEVVVDFRDWTQLLVVSNASGAASVPTAIAANSSRQATINDVVSAPTISAEMWSTYALVTTDERKRMGKVPRDMVWEIVQTMSDYPVLAGSSSVEVPLRYANAVKSLFFSVTNFTVRSERSNNTSREPHSRSVSGLSAIEFPSPSAFDPIQAVTLYYEGVNRLGDDLYIDFFSLVQPYLFARSVPTLTGYHMWSYSLDMVSTDHLGSVDYGKLTNVSIRLCLSNDAQSAIAGGAVTPFFDENGLASPLPSPYGSLITSGSINMNSAGGFNLVPQKYWVQNCSLAHTIVRSIGGAMGFPVF